MATISTFTIKDSTLSLSLEEPIEQQVLYLAAVTKGNVIKSTAINVLVCGKEVMTVKDLTEITIDQN